MNQRKNSWIVPALVLAAGIFNVMNKDNDNTIRTLWYILTPIALLMLVWRLYERFRSQD